MKINRERLWIMAWFTFTRRERNGILVLCMLLFGLQCALVYRYFILPDIKPVQLSARESTFIREVHAERLYPDKPKYSQRPETAVTTEFNPNQLQEEDWVTYGLSPKQAAVISRWKAKGGVFRSKEDVKRMKMIPGRVYIKIEPWLIFDNVVAIKKTPPTTFVPKKAVLIDLNAADTVSLCELPLIGPGRARTIWKFREKLGGYYAIEQLKEIRSIPDSVFDLIINHLEIRTPVYRKIDLNTINDSIYHPYFSKSLIRVIIAYRTQNGLFTSTSDLLKLPLVNEDLWRKIAPYIFLSPEPAQP
jgi:competence protein ComEA